MEKIYLDNASTSFPKPLGMVENMMNFMNTIGCNINRGGYQSAYTTAEIVFETRERLCALFHFPDSKNVVFTGSVTQSLNILIKGLLKPGDHVLTSSMEHNAVMRPLIQMAGLGIAFDRIPCTDQGVLCIDKINDLIKPSTKAIIMTHASNICGTLMPLKAVGAICKERGIYFIVDCAQTAGIFPIDMGAMNIDALAFTGHKGLLGPQGIGGFIVSDEMAEEMVPLISGGTGSVSDSEMVPDFLPDKFEAGTLNLPGIYGLYSSLGYLLETGIDNICKKELDLTNLLLEGLNKINEIRVVGLMGVENRAPVVSITCKTNDNSDIAYRLDSLYGVMTRVGMHCAPNAHKTLGTFPEGTIRFSMSHFNTSEEIAYALESLKKCLASPGEY
ncbi:MAG: aminotransferase class V-fold PLP-dependent enzyme [Cellulosilyticaceae bacterium]